MKQYIDALKHVLEHGAIREDRTGTGTIGTFGYQMRFNLQEGFPAVTTKKLAWKAVVSELLWFLEGSDDERRLAEILYDKDRLDITDKKTIWTANADKQGKELGYTNSDRVKLLGPVYGVQWRSWNGKVDQIKNVIEQIKEDPYSRRLIVSAWNAEKVPEMALPPCHTMFQFYVQGNKLSCQLYQRSADMFLGVPFNIASYALLTHIIAELTGLQAGEFVHTIGDAHIYVDHLKQVHEQLLREPMDMPKLVMPKMDSLEGYIIQTVDDFKLEGYNPMPSIPASMAV